MNAMSERIVGLNAFFEAFHSGDEYARDALTHVVACSLRFSGYLLFRAVQSGASATSAGSCYFRAVMLPR